MRFHRMRALAQRVTSQLATSSSASMLRGWAARLIACVRQYMSQLHAKREHAEKIRALEEQVTAKVSDCARQCRRQRRAAVELAC